MLQEKDHVPEDCGSVKDIREPPGVDPVHDAGANTEGNRYVSGGGVDPHLPGVRSQLLLLSAEPWDTCRFRGPSPLKA